MNPAQGLSTAVVAACGAWLLLRALRRALLLARRDKLAGRVIVITGASRGIGRSLAIRMARAGARLVLTARRVDQLEKTAAACQAARPDVEILIVPADITRAAQREALVRSAVDRFGHIDILINNAGIIQGGTLAGVSPESVCRQIETNLISPMLLTQLVLPGMLERRAGHIVNVGSAASRHAMPFFAAYSASKYGLLGFTDSLRRELADYGVRVTFAGPGYTDTDMVAHARQAWRRMGFQMMPPDRVARRIAEGIILEQASVHVGMIETLGAWLNPVAPGLLDLYWRILPPRNLGEIAARQKTD